MPMVGTLAGVAMQEPTFFILTALAEEPRHGYGVMRAVAELSDGRINLRAGTLYAALDRLAADGLLTVDREEAVEGRLRRYYRLTRHGVGALGAEVERLRTNADLAAARIRPAGRSGPAALGTA
jgi:PadR family transcriptional regulator, regulatory protein PadR